MFSHFKTHEMDWQDGAQQIKDCDYLFATSISEIEELTLGLNPERELPPIPEGA